MREVTPKLWTGNALKARNIRAILDAGIEAIVDLAIEEPPISATRELICCRIPLSDGAGNSNARIALAVETICKLIESGTPTLVACSAGMSRSPAIAAAALSRLQGVGFAETLTRIAEAGTSDVSPALLADIVSAVGKNRNKKTPQ